MKFFDYKFLILLGLTLVVYFIYREVEFLRSKVNKIETELNQKKLKLLFTAFLSIMILTVVFMPTSQNG